MNNPYELRYNAIGNFRPTCAVCGRPVDFIRVEYDALYRTYHCIVQCHGETEECDLDERAVLMAVSISGGMAFTKSRRLKHKEPTQ